MGSGSSKNKNVSQKRDSNSPENGNRAVTNVNKSPVKSATPISESINNVETSVKSSTRVSDHHNDNSPKKSKVSTKKKCDSESDFEDDLDKFIQETVSTAAAANNEDPSARPRTSHGRSGRSRNTFQESLPETYAQKHTREQYTVDRQMLIREKTIYRNPDEWGDDLGDDPDDNHGFDASKFRQVNTNKATNTTSAVQQDLETPRYIKSQEDRRESNYGIYEKDRKQAAYDRRISRLPSYDIDEQRLLADLENEF